MAALQAGVPRDRVLHALDAEMLKAHGCIPAAVDAHADYMVMYIGEIAVIDNIPVRIVNPIIRALMPESTGDHFYARIPVHIASLTTISYMGFSAAGALRLWSF